jgi:hypothetical protein
MGRRIRWLGVIMVACFGLVVAQLVDIQPVKAKALQNSPYNPRVAALRDVNPRGMILAADPTLAGHGSCEVALRRALSIDSAWRSMTGTPRRCKADTAGQMSAASGRS